MPFLFSDFDEGNILAHDLGSDDFDLPTLDDSFDGSGNEGSGSQNEEDSESSVKVHDCYNDDVGGGHTLNVTTIPSIVFLDDDECESMK